MSFSNRFSLHIRFWINMIQNHICFINQFIISFPISTDKFLIRAKRKLITSFQIRIIIPRCTPSPYVIRQGCLQHCIIIIHVFKLDIECISSSLSLFIRLVIRRVVKYTLLRNIKQMFARC